MRRAAGVKDTVAATCLLVSESLASAVKDPESPVFIARRVECGMGGYNPPVAM